ncbi:MAG: ATP-binding protein [Oligoflexales bacterium]|nr:ATP-binding protein [Oligoflexales bacterium]
MVDLPNDEEVFVLADRVTLGNQVINNILSNAVKFSYPEGTITIKCENSGSEEVVLSIMDQGIGMPDSLKEKLFSLGEQTSRNGTAGERGTGFGMPLVKTFVDYYGGRVEIKTSEKIGKSNEHGTTFFLYLKPRFCIVI